MFIIGYWCDCQEKEQEQEQDILTVGKEIYEHRYCTYEKLALKLARQTNAGQTDRQTGPARAHMRRGSGFRRSTKFLLFSFRVLFLFFFFFFCMPSFWLVSCIVYTSGPSIFTLFTLIFLCRAFCFMLHSVPPSLSLSPSLLPPLRLAICLIVRVLVFPFTFSVMCAEAAWRETGRQRAGRCIYFVSTCSWYLFYESNYLYWNMAYTWDSCVALRHISIFYFWRACAEIWCCCQFLMVNMMFPLTSLADMHIFISGLRVPKSACVWVCAPALFARTWVSSLTCFLKKTWQRFHLQALPTPASAFGVCDYFLSSLKKLKCSFY